MAIETAHRQRDGAGAIGPVVGLQRLLLQPRHADPGDAGVHAGEELRHQGPGQADGLEVRSAPIGRDHRDAHLGDDLQKTRLDALLEVQAGVAQGQVPHQAPLQPVLEGLLRQPGVHRRGPHADQHRKAVGVHAFRRADDDGDVGAQAPGDQVAVHTPGGQHHGHGAAVGAHALVGQHDLGAAGQRRLLRLGADAVQMRAQGRACGRAGGGQGEGAVDHRRGLLPQHAAEPLVHAVGQDRAFQHVDVGLGLVLGQDVAEVLEAGLQAHHRRLPQGVDGRIGHLAEVLAEEVAQGPIALRQHRQRRVVAHGADRLLALLGQGGEDQFHVLQGQAGSHLAAGQGLPVQLAGLGARPDPGLQGHDVLQPFRIRMIIGQGVDQLLLVVEAALLQVHGQHPAGGDVGLGDDAALIDAAHAGFGAHDQKAVGGAGHPQGAQAVAVLARHHPAAVRGAHRRGAVPRLHHRVAIGIEGRV